jgi:hypothetical protein
MRGWVAVLAVGLAGCCGGKRAAPAAVVDVAEPVVLRNDQGGTVTPLLNSDGLCSNVTMAIATQDWVAVARMSKPPNGCEVKGRVKATLTRRGKDCHRVRLDSAACKGVWWVGTDWVGK